MPRSDYGSLLNTHYPAIRRVLREEYRRLDDEELEDVITEMFPGAEADDVENFMRSLQQFGRQAAPIAQKALPGAIQGAVTGGMVAGPYGAIAGGLLGGAAGALSGPPQAAPSPASAAQPAAPPQAPAAPRPTAAPLPAVAPQTLVAPPATTSAPAQAAPGNDALQRLLFLLSRPETARALSSLLVAQAGRPTQTVAGREAPAMAFANAISELAGEVVDSYAANEAAYGAGEGGVAGYLFDEVGTARADLFNPAARAALLVADMASVAIAEAAAEAEAEDDAYDDDADWDEDEEYDDDEWVDLADAYAGRAGRGVRYVD